MTEEGKTPQPNELAERLAREPIYRGPRGVQKRLGDLLPPNVSLGAVMPRLVNIIAGPYREQVHDLSDKAKANAAERRALARKANQTPDVVLRGDLGLAEVAEIVFLHQDGLSATRIAKLFDLPTSHVKDVLSAMEGKQRDAVIYNGEMRRRRAEKWERQDAKSARNKASLMLGDAIPTPEGVEEDGEHVYRGH